MLLLSPKIGIYLILGKTRIFLKKVGLSHFSVYWTLNSCRKLGKSNKSILCKDVTDRQIDARTELNLYEHPAKPGVQLRLSSIIHCVTQYIVSEINQFLNSKIDSNNAEFRHSWVRKSSHKFKLRKMMLHFEFLIQKFFFRVTNSTSQSIFHLEVLHWKLNYYFSTYFLNNKFHFELLTGSWKTKSFTSSY